MIFESANKLKQDLKPEIWMRSSKGNDTEGKNTEKKSKNWFLEWSNKRLERWGATSKRDKEYSMFQFQPVWLEVNQENVVFWKLSEERVLWRKEWSSLSNGADWKMTTGFSITVTDDLEKSIPGLKVSFPLIL